MDLITRDRREHGGAAVLCAGPGEVLRERWRGAIVYNLPTGQRRCGCAPPFHYDDTGVWTPDAPHTGAGLDAWVPIDLRPGLSAAHGVTRRVHRAGITSSLLADGSVTCERGGSTVTLRPVALAWVNAAGEQQVIAQPTMTRPVDDEDGLWCRDAFGQGIDWGMRLWPDMTRPVIRIANPRRFLLTNPPLIGTTGLRLAKILSVGHGNGRVIGLRSLAGKRGTRPDLLTGRPTERLTPTAPIPLRHSQGNALWFAGARAWDDEQSWEVRSEWQRFGDAVQVICSVPVEAVTGAVGALCLDTTMAEQQVGASADDAYERGTLTATYTSTVLITTYTSSTAFPYCASGVRFASVPLPLGSTIDVANLTFVASTGEDDPDMTIYSQLSPSPVDFATDTHIIDPAYRPRSISGWYWYADNIGNGTHVTGDLSTPMQGVVDQAGWASGNPVVWLLIPSINTLRVVRFNSYDSSAANAAKLNATYTEGGGGTAIIPISQHYARLRRRA